MSPAPQISLCERDSVICVRQTWRALSPMLHLFDDPDIVTERGDCVVGRPAQLASHCACKSSVQMRPRNLSAHSFLGCWVFFCLLYFKEQGDDDDAIHLCSFWGSFGGSVIGGREERRTYLPAWDIKERKR